MLRHRGPAPRLFLLSASMALMLLPAAVAASAADPGDVYARCLDDSLAFDARAASCSAYLSGATMPSAMRSAALSARGWSHLAAGRFDAARSDFYAAGRIDDDRARLNSNLGLAALAREFESFALARQLTTEVLSVEPLNAKALFIRGISAAALGDFAAAMADAERLISADPSRPDGYELKGLIHHHRALTSNSIGDYGAAAAEYERAMALASPPPDSLLRRYGWLLSAGPPAVRDVDRGVDLTQQALPETQRRTANPRRLAQAHHAVAVALAANGAINAAEAELEAVMEEFPGARSRFQKALAGAGYLDNARSATLYELLGAIHACLEDACGALSVPLIYETF